MIELILAILATYRVAAMLATEEGAFSIFAKVRERIDPQQKTWIGRGLNCPLCIGFWVAAIVAVFVTCPNYGAYEFARMYALNWLAIAGGAMLLQKLAERWDLSSG